MNTNRPFGAIKLTIALFCIGLVSPISLFGQGCPFPPPTAVNVDACDGGSTLIDLFNQIPPPLPVWSETFDEDGAGVVGACAGADPSTCATNNPPSNAQWSVTGNTSGLVATSDYFQVIGGQLVARDLDAEVCFTSAIIDISSFASVDFSADILEMGDHETTDYADVTIIVDGTPTMIPNWMGLGNGSHTLVGDIPDDFDWIATTVAALGITGSTLQIEICLSNGADTENIIIDNVFVADPSNLPGFNFYSDVGLMTLLAGDVTEYDPMTTLITTPDTVWVTTTDGMCETSATEMIVTVSPNPIVVAGVANATVCEGEDIALMETGGEANLWSWTGPNGFVSSDQNPTFVSE